jgi:hypothetical protein
MAIFGLIMMSMPLGLAIGLSSMALFQARFDCAACRDQPNTSE